MSELPRFISMARRLGSPVPMPASPVSPTPLPAAIRLDAALMVRIVNPSPTPLGLALA